MSEQSPDLENRFIPNPLDYDVLGDFDVDAAEARLDAHLQAQSSQTIIDADEIRALSAAYHASLGIVEMIPGELSDLRAHAAIAAATAGDLAVRSIFQQKDAEDQKIHTAHLEAKLAYSAREKDAAEELSTIDPLTKLPNRHALVQYLDQIKGLAQRAMHDRQLPANVLFGIIDLDDFKQKNTEYTHAGGDEVIKQVALMIRSSLRETDILLRIGGDELAVLLPDTDVEGGVSTLNRVCKNVEKLDITVPGIRRAVKQTVTIGFTEIIGDTFTLPQLIERASTGLLEAKDKGKNQVVYMSSKQPNTSEVSE